MQEIGIISFVQVQRNHMKIWGEADRIYHTDPLLVVPKLRLTPDGIIGITSAGEEIVDVHNLNHHDSRNRDINAISIGFLQTYQKLRDRFGNHLKDGDSGDNIVVDASVDPEIFKKASKAYIKSQSDGSLIELTNVIHTPPCREFAVFCLQVPQCKDDIKSALQFLDNGNRGYYVGVESNATVYVQAGDTLLVD